MSKDNFKTSLSWDDFKKLGNPDNPELSDDRSVEESDNDIHPGDVVRIYLEKKGRRGKSVTLVKGLDLSEHAIGQMAKSLRSICGVGGSVKNQEIILQGDQRKKAQEFLQLKGYNNVKLAGS